MLFYQYILMTVHTRLTTEYLPLAGYAELPMSSFCEFNAQPK